MKILGNSRGVATVLAVAIGLAVVPVATRASAQLAPTGSPTNAPPAKPSGPAGQPATPATPATPVTSGAAKPATPPAGAPKPADVNALMASGQKKFKAADYAGALADLGAANTAKASPEAERLIGLSHDNLGHFAEAVVAYER